FDSIDAVQYRSGQAEQHLPIVGQAEFSRRPMKEPDPKMFFQLRNLPRHRRLAYLALTGNGGKGTRLDHPYQDAECAQKVHRFPRKTQRSFKTKRDYL